MPQTWMGPFAVMALNLNVRKQRNGEENNYDNVNTIDSVLAMDISKTLNKPKETQPGCFLRKRTHTKTQHVIGLGGVR